MKVDNIDKLQKEPKDDEGLLEYIDLNAVRLLACIKFLHTDINKKISDPEMYLILYDWLDRRNEVGVRDRDVIVSKKIPCINVVKNFPNILDSITRGGEKLQAIKNNLKDSENKIFIPSTACSIFNVACKRQIIFELAIVRLNEINKERNMKNITNDLQEQSMGTPPLEIEKLNKTTLTSGISYNARYETLQAKISKQLKQIKIHNKKDMRDICREVDGEKSNKNDINVNNKAKENENNINQTNINIRENNNFDKTSNIINKGQRKNLIKKNNNEIKEKNTNSFKNNNNDIQKKKQKAKSEKQLSKELEKKSNANDVNIQIKHMRNENKIEEEKDPNTNNIPLQNKNIHTKISNNNIDESKLKINPEISSRVEINNKNPNEIKPQNKNSNDGLIIEDQNEITQNNNNQNSKWNLCPCCNCKCWPFN